MARFDAKHFADMYLGQYIDPVKQYEDIPNLVINGWVIWLYDKWNTGQINLSEYRKLLNVDIGKYTGV
jgi:hypothetical protein